MSSIDSTVSDVPGVGAGEVADSLGSETITETEEAAETDRTLPIDAIFEVLKNERRRRVIEYLRSADGPVELGSVAEHIAALENDKEEAAITYAERKRVYVGLYQCHLPKMDDMGVVDFNRARGRIELTDQAAYLVPYLEGPVSQRPWYRYYGAIVLGGMGLYAATLGRVFAGLVTPQIVLLGVLAAVGACAAVQATRQD